MIRVTIRKMEKKGKGLEREKKSFCQIPYFKKKRERMFFFSLFLFIIIFFLFKTILNKSSTSFHELFIVGLWFIF